MKRLILGLLLSMSALSSIRAFSADYLSQPERLALEQVLRDLTVVQSLIDVARQQRNSHTRFPLDYTALTQDLSLIIHGLERHLSAPVRSPRPIEPIDGEYRP